MNTPHRPSSPSSQHEGAATPPSAQTRALSRLGKPEFFADFGAEFLQHLPRLLAPETDPNQPPLETFLSLLSNQPLDAETRARVLDYTLQVPHHVRLGIGQRVQDSDEVLRALKVPVLVTHGEEDKIVLSTTSRHIASRVPHAQLSLYPGVGHSPLLPIAGWSDAEFAQENTPHLLGTAKAAGAGDLLDPVVDSFELAPGRLDAQLLGVAGRGLPHFLEEHAGAHRHACGQGLHRHPLARVLGHPDLERGDASKVLRHQRQGELHPGGHPR